MLSGLINNNASSNTPESGEPTTSNDVNIYLTTNTESDNVQTIIRFNDNLYNLNNTHEISTTYPIYFDVVSSEVSIQQFSLRIIDTNNETIYSNSNSGVTSAYITSGTPQISAILSIRFLTAQDGTIIVAGLPEIDVSSYAEGLILSDLNGQYVPYSDPSISSIRYKHIINNNNSVIKEIYIHFTEFDCCWFIGRANTATQFDGLLRFDGPEFDQESQKPIAIPVRQVPWWWCDYTGSSYTLTIT